MYDIIGELRKYANWIGAAVSKCRLYVAEIDENGEASKEVEDPKIAALSAGPLGKGPAKDEALRLLGTNLAVVGECYIVAESEGGEGGDDLWYVVSGSELRQAGSQIEITRPAMAGLGGEFYFREGVDLLIRCWTPHPRRSMWSDSSVRSAIPVLRKIETTMKRSFAELDSRLTGAGLLVLPQNVDFPRGDGVPEGIDGFAHQLTATAMTSIEDRASAPAMVPMVITVPPDSVDKIKFITFWSELSDRIQEMEDASIKRLAGALDIPLDVLTGIGASNHWCTTPDTEIMTRRGWTRYGNLTPGDEVLALDHESGLSQWEPVLDVNAWDVIDEPMVRITGRNHRSLTTGAHRWPILTGKPEYRGRGWTTSAEWATDALSKDPGAQRYEYILRGAPHADLPTEAKFSDALVELVAWYYTEGSRGVRAGRRTPQITIAQSRVVNADHCARIERALTNLFGPESANLDKGGRYASTETVERRRRAREMRADGVSCAEIARELRVSLNTVTKYLHRDSKLRDATPRWRKLELRSGQNNYKLNAAAAEILLEYAPDRLVGLDFVQNLTSAQLELFIDVSIKADGSRLARGTGTMLFGQKDPERNAAFELAAILSGRAVYHSTNVSYGISADGPKLRTQHTVSAGDTTTFSPRGRSFSIEPYTGTVWCPTTPSGTWLARHDGTVFYTGNSAWAVAEETVRIFIEPVLQRIAEALDHGYLNAALEFMGLDPAKYTYAFDISPLTVKPDRGPEALALNAAGLLSDDETLTAHSYGDEQKQKPAERIRHLLEQAIPAKPELLADPLMLCLLGLDEAKVKEMCKIAGSLTPPAATEPGSRALPAAPAAGDRTNEQIPRQEPATNPARGEATPTPVTAAAPDSGLWCMANLAMVRALGVAGSRLVSHRERDNYPDTAKHALHVRYGPITGERAEAVLRGVWEDLAAAADEFDADRMRQLLHEFAADRLTRGVAYDPAELRQLVATLAPHLARMPAGVR